MPLFFHPYLRRLDIESITPGLGGIRILFLTPGSVKFIVSLISFFLFLLILIMSYFYLNQLIIGGNLILDFISHNTDLLINGTNGLEPFILSAMRHNENHHLFFKLNHLFFK